MEQPIQLKNNVQVSSENRREDRAAVAQRDEAVLAQFGKKQQLKRRFGLLSVVGLTCNLMITWEGVMITMAEGLNNGGPLGLITTFIFAWVGVTAQGLVMAEMGSMIPVSGGQYNWVAVLAPSKHSHFLSYITGWITTIAWQALTASLMYLVATFVQGLAILNWPDYSPTNWQTTLLIYAAIALSLFVNTILARILPQLESTQLIIHILGFFAILIPLAYLGRKASAHDVFQVFVNGGGWSTKGLTFFVGINNTMLALLGIDGATHLAEEIEDASRVIPKAIIIAAIVAGVTGLAMLIAILFSIQDLNAVLNTPTDYPLMEIFKETVGSSGGATGMIVVLAVILTLTTIACLATSSRMLWAFAREKAVPFHSYVSRVDPRSSLPLTSIGICVIVNVLLALINIGSSAAFNAFTSVAVAAFYVSFIISAVVLLRRRFSGAKLPYGPFNMGRYSVPVTVFAIAYSLIGAFFSLWPQDAHPSLKEMNWSVVIFAGVLVFSILYWFVSARKTYTGPVVEVSLEELTVEEQTRR